MRKPTRKFVFRRVYEMAALIEGCIEDPDSLHELHWTDPDLLRALGKFSKISLLHRYIYTWIALTHRQDYRANREFYEAAQIADLEGLFDAYRVHHLPYASFAASVPSNEAARDDGDAFYEWFQAEEQSFELLWEKLTDEAFHILFANRTFLLKFNLAVAGFLRNRGAAIPAEYLGSDGRIKRHPLPVWTRDGVFYRDHGRCVLCQVDLSGLLSTDRTDHFDHMVPLALWGTNDPCNIQLVCEACNLKKAAGEPVTGDRYSAWWPD